MGLARNQYLIRYFKDRQVFLLEADEKPPRLSDSRGEKVANNLPTR
jgi:hypothetical protein